MSPLTLIYPSLQDSISYLVRCPVWVSSRLSTTYQLSDRYRMRSRRQATIFPNQNLIDRFRVMTSTGRCNTWSLSIERRMLHRPVEVAEAKWPLSLRSCQVLLKIRAVARVGCLKRINVKPGQRFATFRYDRVQGRSLRQDVLHVEQRGIAFRVEEVTLLIA